MSSVSLTDPTNEAFADIKEELVADEAADPTKKKLGILFWICVGWIVAGRPALATFANLLPLPNPTLGNYNSAQNAGPGWGHLLGTDDLYRDIFSRLIYGARVSLVVGFGGALLGLDHRRHPRHDLGLPAGPDRHRPQHGLLRRAGLPGHRGGHRHRLLLGPTSIWKITLIIGVFGAPLIYRVVRASTLSYATRDFVLAAKALGASDTPHPGPRDPAQHHADDRLLRPDRGGHDHRAGGLAGLPRAVRAATHAELGQHAQRGLAAC